MPRLHGLSGWLLAAILVTSSISTNQAAELIPLGATWKYLLGTQEASTPAAAWRQLGFNDTGWASGQAPIGYDTGGMPGTSPIVTVTPTSSDGNYLGIYFRKTFTVSNPAMVTKLVLTVLADDGAVAWLNGVEVGRTNVPAGELAYNRTALVADELRTLTTTDISGLLVAGANVLAIQVLNGNETSSDLVMDALLTATVDEPPTVVMVTPTPGTNVLELSSLDVVFSENVSGVEAADLRVNGQPVAAVSVVSPREYVFSFPQPPTGAVTVAWAPEPQIVDLDLEPTRFIPGPAWTYNLDPNALPANLIISEFLADNGAGIRDEDGNRSDWLEIYNRGPADINLGGWFLTDNPANLALWRFPNLILPANRYLLVWASQKNKTNAAAPLHTNFKLGKDAGGYLALVSPATNVISAFVSYPGQAANISFGRDRVEPELVGYFTTPTPGAQNSTRGADFAPEPQFSLESGIYTNSALTLVITPAPGTVVRYTFNGSEPATNSPVYSTPLVFTTNMLIKVRAYSTNTALWPSPVAAREFILLDNTARDFNSNLPILVISTQGRAIPVNVTPGTARPRGIFASLDTFRGRSALRGKTDFLGLGQFEITGQTSADFVKKPYRIEINDEMGNDQSASVLGLPAEADWMLRNPYSDKCLMNDFLGYELWEDMGHYSCRRRFVELFVDESGGKLTYPGDYRGVLVLFERIEIDPNRVNLARLTPAMTNEPAITGGYIIKKDKDSAGDAGFSTTGGAGHSSHFLKFHDPKPREITTQQSTWIRNYVNRFEASMYAAGWTNATGTNHYSHYIDVDAFVDQHLHVEFTKQIDGYRLSSYYSKDRNGKLMPTPVWDWNLSFGNADYLQGGKTNGWYWNLEGEGMNSGTHIWLRRLIYGNPSINSANPANGPGDPDFRQKITDRWAVLRTNVLNGDRIVARIDALATLLTEAAARNYTKYPGILNSYLWPNPQGPPSWDVDYTQPTYAGIISEMKKWTQGRFVWMDNQFLKAPFLNAEAGPISPDFNLTITALSGKIYYTLDGTDPRLPGGGIAPGARPYTAPITLSGNARVVARAYSNPTSLWTPWSAPTVATFVVETPKLVITEIMYHPLPPASGANTDEDFEYLELKNTSASTLNLKGFTLSGGIDFTFPDRQLPAGQRILVVNNLAAFTARYGNNQMVAGEYTGNLANDGNRLALHGPLREPILDFSYDDDWYPITDGFGFSLVVADENAPLSSWGLAANWRPNGTLGGTPGQDETTVPVFPQVVINEALSVSDSPPPYDTVELRNLSATSANLGGWFLTDDFREPKKFRIPAGVTIPAHGYLIFDERDFNSSSLTNTPFALSALGDEIYLFSGDANGNLTGYYHGFTFGPARSGSTFGRHLTSTGAEHFVRQSSATLGAANAGPAVGPVVFSELMYRPPDVFTNNAYWNNDEDEYVELRNITDFPVNLFDPARPTNSWKLDDAIAFSFPSGTVLPANSYLLVVNFDPAAQPAQLAAFRTKFSVVAGTPIFGPYQGTLNNSDEHLRLLQPAAASSSASEVPYVLVDAVHYTDHAPWPVTADGLGHGLQRLDPKAYGNDPANWVAGGPTPGAGWAGGEGPVISVHPVDQTVPSTGQATLSGSASGPGLLRYQWSFNGNFIGGATSSQLVLSNVQPAQAGDYQLLALNPYGVATSRVARLTVLTPATILQQPISQAVTNGSNVTFLVVATTRNPPLRYQWLHNGIPIPFATNATLSLSNVLEEVHSGDYVVAVTDGNGTIPSQPAKLTVLLRPAVIQPVPPLQLTAVAGENLTLSVEARGTKPMLYRWRRVLANGTGLTLANHFSTANFDSFTVTNVSTNLNGAQFLVVLTNAAYTAQNLSFTNCSLTVLADSNGNGLPDVWESAYFGSPTGANRDADPDQDGHSNWQEYLAGTIPTNQASCLRVESLAGADGARLSFQASSNRSYSVLYQENLTEASWRTLLDIAAQPTNRTATIHDPAPGAKRYYRIVTPKN